MVKKDPIKAIIRRFEADCKDQELTTRFNGFIENERSMVSRFNSMLDKYQKFQSEQSLVENLIFTDLYRQDPKTPVSESLINRRKSIIESMRVLDQDLAILRVEINANKALIDKYKVCSDKVMFQWWQTLKDIGYFTGDWLSFKAKYGHIQF
jgi:hypothetical protein